MTIVKQGLKAYYNSKQGVSTSTWDNIATKTIGTLNASVYGATLQSNGVSLDGVDDFVAISTNETEIKDFTINFMLKSNTSNFESTIDLSLYVEGYGEGAGYTVGAIGEINGSVYLRKNGDKLLGSATNNVGFSLRYTASTGVLEHIFPDGSVVIGTTAQLRVIAISYKSKSFLNVVRYYDRALTNQEIQQNYAEGTEIGLSITKELFTNVTLIPNTHSDYLCIFINAYTDSRFELLVTAKDLLGAGFQEFDVIQDLRFYAYTASGIDLTNIKIGIKHTAKTNTVDGVFDAYSTFTEVFNQAVVPKGSAIKNVWFPFTFSNAFTWNGIDNILITFIKDGSTKQYSGRWNVRIFEDIERFKGWRSDNATSPYDTQNGTLLTIDPSPKTAPITQLTVADRTYNLYTASAIVNSTSSCEAKPINSSNYVRGAISSSPAISSKPIREFHDGADTIVKAGLVGYWNAKQGITSTQWDNIAPDTLGSYNGAITGAIATTDGLYFDGIDDIVKIPAIPSTHLISNDVTVETWVKIDASTFTQQYIVGSDFYGSLLHKDGMFIVRGADGLFGSSATVNHGTMNHIVLKMNTQRQTVELSVNGVNVILFTATISGSLKWQAKTIEISSYFDGTTTADYYKFKGTMPLLRIYNRTLDEDEVARNYNLGYEIALEPPITGTPPSIISINTNKQKISDETNMNQSVITIQFDTDVIQYVARLNGVDHTTGILVHQGGAVSANTDAQVIIDWNELTTEGQNRINIYGENANGWTTYVE